MNTFDGTTFDAIIYLKEFFDCQGHPPALKPGAGESEREACAPEPSEVPLTMLSKLSEEDKEMKRMVELLSNKVLSL